jgi:predicted transcriptional regulator
MAVATGRKIAPMPAFDRRSKRQRASDDPVARYLGEAQAEVIGIFWGRESATVRQALDELNGRRSQKLAYTTVLTMITRLWQRGLLKREAEGRGFRYRAARTRNELLAELSDELIDRLLDDFGDVAVARLGERLERLDPELLKKLEDARERGT